jgi:hypothetical protein
MSEIYLGLRREISGFEHNIDKLDLEKTSSHKVQVKIYLKSEFDNFGRGSKINIAKSIVGRKTPFVLYTDNNELEYGFKESPSRE